MPPCVLLLSTIHIHLNQLVFHHLSTKRLQARFLSHSLLINIRTPRNLQGATRSTAHLAGAPRILLRLIDPWCFVLFLCRALHSIATYELINVWDSFVILRMECKEEDYCQFHIPEIRQTASSLQWRREVDGLFLMVSLMQY